MNHKQEMHLLANKCAIAWNICMIGVIGILAYATKLATHDPSFSTGGKESLLLLPLLIFSIVGFLSFPLMIITYLLSIPEKSKFLSSFSIKHNLVLGGFIIFSTFSFLFGFRQGQLINFVGNFTGQELLTAVNKIRVEKGINEITLDHLLCDNLVQRYLDITNPDNEYAGHIGFERWATNEGLDKNYYLAELYIKNSENAERAINFWLGSPGHSTELLSKNYDVGCTYADKGSGVLILGKRK